MDALLAPLSHCHISYFQSAPYKTFILFSTQNAAFNILALAALLSVTSALPQTAVSSSVAPKPTGTVPSAMAMAMPTMKPAKRPADKKKWTPKNSKFKGQQKPVNNEKFEDTVQVANKHRRA
ncbi:hypothetical protein H072_1562 [Dactylellina haptotyla CBS 200.50]|uniref:Uncharacterized protein n=1 Tax=Dactylellina haptotyla (strain CBS 200.50) TaxID=1284197 RepID=S8ANM4_DACHA|nr:hypothetical protein H072_1562 [Dactylellina haptotyla CBS 200.50]